MVLALPQTEVSSLVSSLVGEEQFSVVNLQNLQLWLDATDEETITKDGSNVISVMTDKSGNGNDTRQTTAGSRPTWLASEDGSAAVQSTNKSLLSDDTIASVDEETIFMVVRVDAVNSGADYLFGSNAAGSYGAFHSSTGDLLNWATENSTDGTGAVRNLIDINIGSKFKILTFRRSVTLGKIEVYENGLLMGIETHNVNAIDQRMQVGARGSLAAECTWREFIWSTSHLDDATLAQVHNYLNNKYDIYTVPSSNDNDFVNRYMIANDITDPDTLTSAYYIDYIGDSTCVGFADKANFDSGYIKLFDDAYINNSGGTAWLALDSRDAATDNNLGRVQGEAGMEVVLAEEISTAQSADCYIMKFGISGSTLANVSPPSNWNVEAGFNNTSSWATRIRRYKTELIADQVLNNGTRIIDLGLVIFLGTNDANNSTNADAAQANYQDLINWWRGFPGFISNKVCACEIFSNSASYPEINTVRAAIEAVASNDANVTFIDGMDDAGDTTDGTHPNAATYENMGGQVVTVFTS